MIAYCCMLILFAYSNLHTCELSLQKTIHVYNVPTHRQCYLGVDIGGTNSDFGVFTSISSSPKKPLLLMSFHTETKNIKSFCTVVSEILTHIKNDYNIDIKHACIGAPGIQTKQKDYSEVRGFFTITSNDLKKINLLETALIINDFSAIGYGLDHVSHNIVQLNKIQPHNHALRAVIGAGTGLGTAFMAWNKKKNSYKTHLSIGGGLTFAPSNDFEFQLVKDIRSMVPTPNNIAWTHFISGKGIICIYNILKSYNTYNDSLSGKTIEPSIIFYHFNTDELCKETLSLYFKLFARFAQNYSLTLLPYGGLFIAGGIVAKQSPLFHSLFMKEYTNCANPCYQKIFSQIPVFIVMDYNVSLYGAAQYLLNKINI